MTDAKRGGAARPVPALIAGLGMGCLAWALWTAEPATAPAPQVAVDPVDVGTITDGSEVDFRVEVRGGAGSEGCRVLGGVSGCSPHGCVHWQRLEESTELADGKTVTFHGTFKCRAVHGETRDFTMQSTVYVAGVPGTGEMPVTIRGRYERADAPMRAAADTDGKGLATTTATPAETEVPDDG